MLKRAEFEKMSLDDAAEMLADVYLASREKKAEGIPPWQTALGGAALGGLTGAIRSGRKNRLRNTLLGAGLGGAAGGIGHLLLNHAGGGSSASNPANVDSSSPEAVPDSPALKAIGDTATGMWNNHLDPTNPDTTAAKAIHNAGEAYKDPGAAAERAGGGIRDAVTSNPGTLAAGIATGSAYGNLRDRVSKRPGGLVGPLVAALGGGSLARGLNSKYNIGQTIRDALPGLMSSAEQGLGAAGSGLASAANSAVDTIGSGLSSARDAIGSGLSSAGGAISDAAGKAYEGASSLVTPENVALTAGLGGGAGVGAGAITADRLRRRIAASQARAASNPPKTSIISQAATAGRNMLGRNLSRIVPAAGGLAGLGTAAAAPTAIKAIQDNAPEINTGLSAAGGLGTGLAAGSALERIPRVGRSLLGRGGGARLLGGLFGLGSGAAGGQSLFGRKE